MNETSSNSPPLRRQGDDPESIGRRIGVLWSADATTVRHKIWSTVLDISPDGAKLRIDTVLLGQVEKFRLAVESLGPIECAPVWQYNGRLGVRFISGQPSMSQLQNLLASPPKTLALN
jgi:hypothetical protein